MEATSFDHPEAIAAAMGVLDRHLAALNSGDAAALAQTLHFPHYRLAGGRMKIWERPETYLQDFYDRVGHEWHHSAWDFRKPISSVLTKCTSTCSSAGTALTDHYWVGIALCGSLVWSTNVGLHSCGRALLPRCRSRRQQHQDHRKSGRTIRGRLPK